MTPFYRIFLLIPKIDRNKRIKWWMDAPEADSEREFGEQDVC